MSEQGKANAPEVVMYTQALCGYCTAARKLLRSKGIDFVEINVTMNAARRREMTERSGRRTVPQIFINDQHIGGYDDMARLDRQHKLDALLAAK